MENNNYPWQGCGASLDITGCRFSLYPMDDDFVPIITSALEKTDCSAVWSRSDALSTVYRGKLAYVVDAMKALFVNAFREGVHMALEGQLSKGCPGDGDGDCYLSAQGDPPNGVIFEGIHFPVLCKLALYPMGRADYMDYIAEAFYMAEKAGLQPDSVHYATRVAGDVQQVFDYLQNVCAYMEGKDVHYILHFTISVNSPTDEA
jgi:uncharacterized protein YqgV (UPF0045/DUF77 family)